MEQPTRFADAMMVVGWLVESAKAVELLRFADHNGASAKRRAMQVDRKRSARMSASDADEKRTREEKRSEEQRPASTSAVKSAKPKAKRKGGGQKCSGQRVGDNASHNSSAVSNFRSS